MCVAASQLGSNAGSGTDSVLQQNADGTRTWVATSGLGGITALTGDVTAGPGSGSQAATLAASGVTAGTYGDGTHVAQVTVDAKGRVTGAAAVTITGAAPTGSAGGDLTGTYPNPTIATGATPQVARLGLGTAADSAAVLKAAGQYYSPEVTDTVSGGAATVDWNSGNEHYLSLTAATTLTFANPKGGGRYVLLLQQDATGSRTVTWPASVLWSGGTAPTLTTTPSKTDLVTLLYSAALGKYIGNYALNF